MVAELFPISDDEKLKWQKWVEERPPTVRKICERFYPNRLYRLKSTGQRGIIYSISEDGTVTMDFYVEYNPISFTDLQVFGLNPDDIEECDDLRTGFESLEPEKKSI